MLNNNYFTSEENTFFSLRRLYESFGYKQYKMRKFEEYSLYLENKDFLKSEYIITFNEPGGKLMALKPDVTLSIVKNTKATSITTERLYYKENVYRMNTNTKQYKEISQMGLEVLGNIDSLKVSEICLLAEKTLSTIDKNYVLEISHIGVIKGLYSLYDIQDYIVCEALNQCVSAKNLHGIKEICEKNNISEKFYETLKNLLSINGNLKNGIEEIRKIAFNDTIKNAVKELESIYNQQNSFENIDKVRLDFSIINSLGYYTGIILRGYIEGIPHVVLSGGRYDKLIKKFKNDISAMGFAIYLDELMYLTKPKDETDFDVLILYSDNSDIGEVFKKAEEMRKEGKKVFVDKNTPSLLTYKEVYKC